jgi:hypothetical protein
MPLLILRFQPGLTSGTLRQAQYAVKHKCRGKGAGLLDATAEEFGGLSHLRGPARGKPVFDDADGQQCRPTNDTAHPALAVPCGKVNGMPISLQLVGKFFADALLLRIAYAYQRAVDWATVTAVE